MCGRVEVLAANTNLHQCMEVTGQLYVSASLLLWQEPLPPIVQEAERAPELPRKGGERENRPQLGTNSRSLVMQSRHSTN
jgi:hypothetical protein